MKKKTTRKAPAKAKVTAKKPVAKLSKVQLAQASKMKKELAQVQKELKAVKARLITSQKKTSALKEIAGNVGKIHRISAKMVTVVGSNKPASNKATRRKAA